MVATRAAWSLTIMSSRKRPSDMGEWLLTRALGRKLSQMWLIVTNAFVVIILNSLFLLPITDDFRVRTSQRTISAYVMY